MTISAWEVRRNVPTDVVVAKSNRVPLTLAKHRILSIHAIPALEPMSYHNGFHINLFTDAVPTNYVIQHRFQSRRLR
jgi:hypothetical protein